MNEQDKLSAEPLVAQKRADSLWRSPGAACRPGARSSSRRVSRRRDQSRAEGRSFGPVASSQADGIVLASDDGACSFVLRRTGDKLFVERCQVPSARLRVVLAMLFDDVMGFEKWCNDEPCRFDDPVLHGKLRRHGYAVLANGR